eukprot:349051_1
MSSNHSNEQMQNKQNIEVVEVKLVYSELPFTLTVCDECVIIKEVTHLKNCDKFICGGDELIAINMIKINCTEYQEQIQKEIDQIRETSQEKWNIKLQASFIMKPRSMTLEECSKKLHSEFDAHNISDRIFQQALNYLSTLSEAQRQQTLFEFLNEFHQHRNRMSMWGEPQDPFMEELREFWMNTFNYDFRNYPESDNRNSWNAESVNNNNETKILWKGRRTLYIQKDGLISSKLQKELLNNIKQLCVECDDYRYFENKPLTDIEKKYRNFSDRFHSFGLLDNENNFKYRIQNLIDPLLSTNKFWIPSIFQIDNNYNVCIKSDINNLSRIQYPKLYFIISKIFSLMIPMFEWILGNICLKNKIIQVIVDMQNYQIKPGEIFIGNLHREGYEIGEGIEAAGIYYFDKSDCFEDDLFEINIDSYMICAGSEKFSKTINIKKDYCMVFNNEFLNHRLSKLVNGSKNKIGTRKILNFFLPKYTIKDSKDINVNVDDGYRFVIDNFVRNVQENGLKMNMEIGVCNLIFKFCENKLIKREKREKLRNERLKGVFNGSVYMGAVN